MQYKKEEVRARIVNAATKAFSNNGFGKTSMLQISHASKVAIGNLYRYFPGKDILFEEIVAGTYKEIFELIDRIYMDNIDITMSNDSEKLVKRLRGIVEVLFEFLERNSVQSFILLNKSHASKYEGFKQELITKISELIVGSFWGERERDITLISRIMAKCLLESVMSIITTIPKEQQKGQIEKLMHFFFYKIEDRLK